MAKRRKFKIVTPEDLLALKGKTLISKGRRRVITRVIGVEFNPYWREEGLVFWRLPNGVERDKGAKVENFCNNYLKNAEIICDD
jgi:hypothetical protein